MGSEVWSYYLMTSWSHPIWTCEETSWLEHTVEKNVYFMARRRVRVIVTRVP